MKYKNKSKMELIHIISGLRGTNGYIRHRLTEYKATIRILISQNNLMKKKVLFLEEKLYNKNKNIIGYASLGKRRNRDIGTEKEE